PEVAGTGRCDSVEEKDERNPEQPHDFVMAGSAESRKSEVGRKGAGGAWNHSKPVSSDKFPPEAAATARRSQRSFSLCPACPRSHFHVILWLSAAFARRSQRSRFFTGVFAAVRQPFACQAFSQFFVIASTT